MKKRLALLLVFALLLTSLSGCSELVAAIFKPDLDLSYPFIGFRTEKPEEVDLDGYTRLSPEQINAYDPVYADYGVTVYYDTLTPQLQLIYRIFRYGVDQAQPCIFIDDRLTEGLDEDWVNMVMRCLALDTPMLEQNFRWLSWNASCTFPQNDWFDPSQPTILTGSVILLPLFVREQLDQKLIALDAAKKIVDEMPQGMNDLEKARYFYNYLGKHVEYYTEEDTNDLRHYLYEALVEGKTNCDGYANAFSLLCYLSGVKCAEKLYSPELKDEIGHTWAAICVDSTWYNVDPTNSKEVKDKYVPMRSFCFADQYLSYTVDMPERAPRCTKNLIGPDVTIEKSSQAGKLVKNAWNAVKKTDRKYVVAVFPGGEQKKSVMQKIANSLKKSIHTVHYVTNSGSAVYYIFPK